MKIRKVLLFITIPLLIFWLFNFFAAQKVAALCTSAGEEDECECGALACLNIPECHGRCCNCPDGEDPFPHAAGINAIFYSARVYIDDNKNGVIDRSDLEFDSTSGTYRSVVPLVVPDSPVERQGKLCTGGSTEEGSWNFNPYRVISEVVFSSNQTMQVRFQGDYCYWGAISCDGASARECWGCRRDNYECKPRGDSECSDNCTVKGWRCEGSLNKVVSVNEECSAKSFLGILGTGYRQGLSIPRDNASYFTYPDNFYNQRDHRVTLENIPDGYELVRTENCCGGNCYGTEDDSNPDDDIIGQVCAGWNTYDFLIQSTAQSCRISAADITLDQGSTENLSVTKLLGEIGSITANLTNPSADSGKITLSPVLIAPSSWEGTSKSYGVTAAVTGNVSDAVDLTFTATTPDGRNTCSVRSVVTINGAQLSSWWQVQGADVTSLDGIFSNAGSQRFNLNLDDYPGIPVYGGETNLLSLVNFSSKKWLVNTVSHIPTYGFNYFYKLVEENVNPANIKVDLPEDRVSSTDDLDATEDGNGYEWYFAKNGFTVPSDGFIVPTGRKIIVLVGDSLDSTNTKDVDITGGVTMVNSGNSLFMVIANGNITIDSSVTELEGVYITDHIFSTGTTFDNPFGTVDDQLTVTGSVVARGGLSNVRLERNLGSRNRNTPGELFVYDPGMLLNIPNIFNQRLMKWKEVAP